MRLCRSESVAGPAEPTPLVVRIVSEQLCRPGPRHPAARLTREALDRDP
ncbi:hypothetical protein [Haloplanus salilacus]